MGVQDLLRRDFYGRAPPRELMLMRIFLMLGTTLWMCFFGTGHAYILKA